jgi:hypothetical protein
MKKQLNAAGNGNVQAICDYIVNLYVVYNGLPKREARRPRTINSKGGGR